MSKKREDKKRKRAEEEEKSKTEAKETKTKSLDAPTKVEDQSKKIPKANSQDAPHNTGDAPEAKKAKTEIASNKEEAAAEAKVPDVPAVVDSQAAEASLFKQSRVGFCFVLHACLAQVDRLRHTCHYAIPTHCRLKSSILSVGVPS